MAAKYRKIDPRIWKDEKFRRLDENNRLIALYCLTAQTNRCGFFNFSIGMMAEDLNLPMETCQTRLRHVCETMKWVWDDVSRVMYFPKWFKYNPPENVSVLIGCLSDLDDLPETPVMQAFIRNIAHVPEKMIDTWQTRLARRVAHQEQEQEQEQEQDEAENSNQSDSIDPITKLEAAFKPMPSPERFGELTKKYPMKGPTKKAGVIWKIIATSPEIASEILKATDLWIGSKRWKEGVGIPNLEKYLEEGYWKNPPVQQSDKPQQSVNHVAEAAASNAESMKTIREKLDKESVSSEEAAAFFAKIKGTK